MCISTKFNIMSVNIWVTATGFPASVATYFLKSHYISG